jgi:hypothetical protein
VKVGAVATPLLFVIADVVVEPPAKVPLAPLDGAAKVTLTLATPLPKSSFTIPCRGEGKGVLITDDCPLPPVAVTDAGTPAPMLLGGVLVPPPPHPERAVQTPTRMKRETFDNRRRRNLARGITLFMNPVKPTAIRYQEKCEIKSSAQHPCLHRREADKST